MGMDLIELVCDIEEEFEVIIPDEIAPSLTTPKQVIDYLMSLPQINEKWSRDYVTLSFWMILEDHNGIYRKDYNEDSRFIEDMRMD